MSILKRLWYWRQRAFLLRILREAGDRRDWDYCHVIEQELERLGGV